MPLKLGTPVSVTASIDAVEIDSFAVDIGRSEIIVGYTQLSGTDPIKQGVSIINGLDYAASISRANELANAMPAGQVNVYAAIKVALYEHLSTAIRLTGTVA